MLVDTIEIELHAGRGGKGAVAFNRVRLMQGPTGGDGGKGGSIYFEGVGDIGALRHYASRQTAEAENGKDGRGQFLDGRDGEDLVLPIPAGTTVTNLSTGFSKDITKVHERMLAAGGGVGGRGNFKFRSSTNTTPKQAEEGTEGDIAHYRLTLRLIADVGLVGLPNAGKSSLLNELTAAKSKVGAYAFTTLEPHLGSYYGLIIADIPGLIEGASEGKGLGAKFLKHVERTNTLLHLISAESDDPIRDYRTIRKELETYSIALVSKKEYVFLSKSDTRTSEEIAQILQTLAKNNIHAQPLSVLDDTSLAGMRGILNTLKDEKMGVQES